MANERKPDFKGYATKNDLLCSDGRTIRRDAFKDDDRKKVPLVWQHMHDDPENVLGHAYLYNRPDGVYMEGYFNETDKAQYAKESVRHGDITGLSIYANKLVQKGKDVMHGVIREVSLVLAGANPGALIDNVCLEHGDDIVPMDDEAIISFVLDDGDDIRHWDNEEIQESDKVEKTEQNEELEHAVEDIDKVIENQPAKEIKSEGESKKTVKEIWDSFSEDEKEAVYAIIVAMTSEGSEDTTEDGDVEHSDDYENTYEGEDETMKHNVFDGETEVTREALSHSDVEAIFDDAADIGSLKASVLAHAANYGIDDIETLFPDAKALSERPEFMMEDDAWVTDVLNGTKHTPFSRIKTINANITIDEARAKGYVKGNQKAEEVFTVLQRVTTPTTIYKKQKLDKDDISDITSFDVVALVKQEMRLKMNEEIALAVMLSDGRSADSADKIKEENIRPIYKDNALYTIRKRGTLAANATNKQKADFVVEQAVRARSEWKGTGTPAFYTSPAVVSTMLLAQDNEGRRLYKTVQDIANDLRVSKVVEIPQMEGANYDGYDLIGIMVNLKDYNIGADQGGALGFFDDFDLDYNQYKYLLETRMSGALVKPYSAVVIEIEHTASTTDAVPMPETAATVFDSNVADLQSGIRVLGKAIKGTLNYYTTPSQLVTAHGEGNFLALKFSAPEDATVRVGLDPSEGSGMQTLDEDMNCVFNIFNPYTQQLVVETTVGGNTSTKFYNLSSLRCKQE